MKKKNLKTKTVKSGKGVDTKVVLKDTSLSPEHRKKVSDGLKRYHAKRKQERLKDVQDVEQTHEFFKNKLNEVQNILNKRGICFEFKPLFNEKKELVAFDCTVVRKRILQDIHYAIIFVFACMILPFMATLAYLNVLTLINLFK